MANHSGGANGWAPHATGCMQTTGLDPNKMFLSQRERIWGSQLDSQWLRHSEDATWMLPRDTDVARMQVDATWSINWLQRCSSDIIV
eukprot:5869723-Heterocapsa_arctica.AAC.1